VVQSIGADRTASFADPNRPIIWCKKEMAIDEKESNHRDNFFVDSVDGRLRPWWKWRRG
jgi:hypothetical protein